jgi:hypothetical protein
MKLRVESLPVTPYRARLIAAPQYFTRGRSSHMGASEEPEIGPAWSFDDKYRFHLWEKHTV